MTKTRSLRIKGTSGNPGQLTIIAFVFSLIFSPIGLIICFFARKEGKSTLLTAAWIISIIGTGLWLLFIIFGMLSWFGFFMFWSWYPWVPAP